MRAVQANINILFFAENSILDRGYLLYRHLQNTHLCVFGSIHVNTTGAVNVKAR